MIELPDDPAPNGVDVEPVDFGAFLRPGGGASILRLNRPGTRLRVMVSYPPMRPDVARVFNRRFQAAKREGLRIDYPLLGLSQGSPGSPVVDGAEPNGTTLPLRGMTPGYAVREGYVLTLIDSAGERYTHFSGNAGRVAADGTFTITDLEPPIRGVFADGDTVLLGRPTIEGAVTEGVGWSLSVDQLVRRGAQIVIEEATGLDPDLGT